MNHLLTLIDVTDPGMQKVLLMALVGAVFGGGYILFGMFNNNANEIKADLTLKQNPNDVDSLITLGLKKMKDLDGAGGSECFEKVLVIEPENFDAHLYLAVYYHFAKDYSQSEKHLAWTVKELNKISSDSDRQKLVTQKHGDNLGRVLYFYGHILYMKGEEQKAQLFKKEALEVSKTFENYKLY